MPAKIVQRKPPVARAAHAVRAESGIGLLDLRRAGCRGACIAGSSKELGDSVAGSGTAEAGADKSSQKSSSIAGESGSGAREAWTAPTASGTEMVCRHTGHGTCLPARCGGALNRCPHAQATAMGVVACRGAGMEIGDPQVGHFTRLPARRRCAAKRFPHWHPTSIVIGQSSQAQRCQYPVPAGTRSRIDRPPREVKAVKSFRRIGLGWTAPLGGNSTMYCGESPWPILYVVPSGRSVPSAPGTGRLALRERERTDPGAFEAWITRR